MMVSSNADGLPSGFKTKGNIIYACNGQGLKHLLQAGQQWLETHLEVVNGLNVFPVPDGDTGTNMVLTMRAALAEIDQSADQQAGAVATSAAQGALMGARGNSGVILSQFLQGLARALAAKSYFNTNDFARAVKLGADQAYQSVAEPVEGTILTVARAVADAAHQYANGNGDLLAQLAGVVDAARIAQASTPDLLPLLKEAGVTDSGGQGLLYILEGGLRFLQEQPLDVDPAGQAKPHLLPRLAPGKTEYGYEIQFLIQGQQLDVAEIRERINAFGRSTVVVGDEQTVKVHLHADDPGVPLSYAVALGTLIDVIVENLTAQATGFAQEKSSSSLQTATEAAPEIAVIAVAPGAGLARIFRSLGAAHVVAGGQSMNPSTQELLAAVESTAAKKVLVLPNNRNITLAAEQTQRMSHRQIVVVPTTSIPQGIAALLAFNQDSDLETNQQRMQAAAGQARTLEITHAVRDTSVNGVDIKQGQIIGLLDHDLQSVGSQPVEVVLDLLAQIELDPYEIVTIYFGRDSSHGQATKLAMAIEAQYPFLEIEVHDGEQPYYQYIISVE